MRIGILSRNPALYSTQRLAAAARARGHQATIIDTTAVAVHIGRDDQPPSAAEVLVGGLPGGRWLVVGAVLALGAFWVLNSVYTVEEAEVGEAIGVARRRQLLVEPRERNAHAGHSSILRVRASA